MAEKQTLLDALIAKGVGLVQRLETMGGKRKLTFQAFLDEAIAFAETSLEKVEKLDVDLNTKPGKSAQQFVAKLVRVFREPNFPRCPKDHGKIFNAYGSVEAFQDLTALDGTVAEAIAVAVLRLHKRFGDDAFGTIGNWDTYESEAKGLRFRLAEVHALMKVAFTGEDIAWSQEGLFQDEIARGLCRATFKRAPGIGPHQADWPRELIAASVSKPKRARLSKAA